MFGDLEDMKTLVDKFSGISASVDSITSFKTEAQSPDEASGESSVAHIDISGSLQQLASTVAERNKKSVELSIQGLDKGNIPESLLSTVQSISTQFVRNSIVHGVEPEEERLAADKPAIATISIRFAETSKGYFLSVKDDGSGIDEEAIIQRAVEKKLISAEKAETMPRKKAPVFLFYPDFSTREQADLDAGRGWGLN